MPIILNKNYELVSRQACPMLASIHWDPAQDTEEDNLAFFQAFYKLPLSIRLGMCGDEIRQAVRSLGEHYRIEDAGKIGEISRMVRDVFMKNVREAELRQRAKQALGLNDYDTDHFLIDLKQVIVLVKQLAAKEDAAAGEQLPIIAALKKYPNVGEQPVTQRPIKLTMFPDPVQPSVKNWLEDYFSRIGTTKHNAMERTDFLFNSENAKQLTQTEREQLSAVLRSYDADEPLTIDVTQGTIVFSERSSSAVEDFFSKPPKNQSTETSRPTAPQPTNVSQSIPPAATPQSRYAQPARPMPASQFQQPEAPGRSVEPDRAPRQPVPTVDPSAEQRSRGPVQQIRPIPSNAVDLTNVTLPSTKPEPKNVVDLSEYA